MISRQLPIVFYAISLVACSTVIIDDWGVSGYARVTGTVTTADGKALSGIHVGLSCGQTQADEFYSGPVTTSSAGTYSLDAEAPGVYGPPIDAGIAFKCSVQAREATGNIVADSIVTLRFVPKLKAATPMTIDLRRL
jgi:hypothetical protein